jgi:hypothetical protein
MALDGFLRDLQSEGRVRIPPPDTLTASERRAAEQTLVELEHVYRLELPGKPPALDVPAASWAAERLLRACQFAVFRDLPAEAIAQEAAQQLRSEKTAAVHYSVDVLFRFLPDLLRLARRAAEQDPLVEHLLGWARAWPLSSVGVQLDGEPAAATFLDDACLRRMYVDRILAADDASRLAEPRVVVGVKAAVGGQFALPPRIAKALSRNEDQQTAAANSDTRHEEPR